MISENLLCSKDFTSNLRDIFYVKIVVTIILSDLVTNSLLLSFCPFLQTKKPESGAQQVGGLVTRNTSVFCLKGVALYFKAMPNSIDFYKGIFLHGIPVRVIVSWLNTWVFL